MTAIRWLGYGGSYLGIDSLKWEFEKDLHLEVSAEWTIKERPFIIPGKQDGICRGENIQFGLLVASNAINRRFKRDGGSGAPTKRKEIPKHWRRKDLLNQKLLNNKPWEALCKKKYKSFIITNINTAHQSAEELEYCKQHNIPVLIYQALKNSDNGAKSWSLIPYEIRNKQEPLKYIKTGIYKSLSAIHLLPVVTNDL